jgi:hypothetical protein
MLKAAAVRLNEQAPGKPTIDIDAARNRTGRVGSPWRRRALIGPWLLVVAGTNPA